MIAHLTELSNREIAAARKRITPNLQALSADQTAHLQDILITIQSSRQGAGASSGEQRAIEHNPGQMIDAEFEEVDEGDTMAALDRLEAEGG